MKIRKLEKTRVHSSFNSILTRTQHLFTKFHKLATRTHSIFNLKTKTRHSYSLAVLLISTHSTLCKKLEIECGNSLTGFQGTTSNSSELAEFLLFSSIVCVCGPILKVPVNLNTQLTPKWKLQAEGGETEKSTVRIENLQSKSGNRK